MRGQVTCSGLGTSLPGSGSLGRGLCWKAAPPPLSLPWSVITGPTNPTNPHTHAHLPALREKALEEGLVASDGWRQGKATTPASETPGLRGPRSGLTKETSDTVCALGFPPDNGPRAMGQSGKSPWTVRVSGAECYRDIEPS